MSRVIVLGGCGGIGSVAVRTLASGDFFDEIVVAEKRYDAAREMAEAIDPERLKAAAIDVEDEGSIGKVIEGSDVVVNCIGPFYRFGPPVLRAVIESGINYVDVCDDLDATEAMLALNDNAKKAGVSALIGMGNSPGLANVLAKWCADEMLSEVESVDIYHAHGGELTEGAAVIKHRIHAMTSEIPLFIDGKFIKVMMLEESGQAFVEKTDFKDVGTYPVYPYPHPETITLPKHLKGIKRVTNNGVVLPLSYFNLTMDTVRLGICVEEPLVVQDNEVVPIEFSVAHIISKRPALLAAAGLREPTGCLKVKVSGKKDGDPHTYVFSMTSKGAGAGEGTGIPAALGAIMMSEGMITEKGVFPPEAGVKPPDILKLAGQVIKGTGMGDKVPIYIEHIDRDGKRESIDFKI